MAKGSLNEWFRSQIFGKSRLVNSELSGGSVLIEIHGFVCFWDESTQILMKNLVLFWSAVNPCRLQWDYSPPLKSVLSPPTGKYYFLKANTTSFWKPATLPRPDGSPAIPQPWATQSLPFDATVSLTALWVTLTLFLIFYILLQESSSDCHACLNRWQVLMELLNAVF